MANYSLAQELKKSTGDSEIVTNARVHIATFLSEKIIRPDLEAGQRGQSEHTKTTLAFEQ
jgi:hypothetical protein